MVTLASKRSTPSKSKGATPSKTATKGAVGKIPSVFVSKDSPRQEKKSIEAPAPTPPKIKTPPPVIDIDFSDDEEELPAVPLKISQPVKSKITSTAGQAKVSELPVKSKPLKSSSQLNATQTLNFPKVSQSKLPPEIKKPKQEVPQTKISSPEDKRQGKSELKSIVKSPDRKNTEIETLKSELGKTKSSLKEKEATILQLQSRPKTPIKKDKEIAFLKRELEKVKSSLNEKEATIKQLDIKIPNMITEFQKCIENKDSMNNINEQKIQELTQNLAEKDKKMTDLVADVNKVKLKLTDSGKEKEELKAKNFKLKNDLVKKDSDVRQSNNLIKKGDQKMKELEEQLKKKESEVSLSNKKLLELDKRVLESALKDEKLEQLHTINVKYKDTINDLRKEKEVLKKEVESKASKHTNQLKKMTDTLNQTSEENTVLKMKITVLEADLGFNSDLVKSKDDELAETKALSKRQADKQQKIIESHVTTIAKQETDRDNAKRFIEKQNQDMAMLRTQNEKLNKIVNQFKAQYQQQKLDMGQLKNQNSGLVQQLAQIQKLDENLDKSLIQKCKETESIKKDLQRKVEEMALLKKTQVKLEKEVKKQLQSKEEEVTLLKTTQAKLYGKINELELSNFNKKESLEAQLKTMKELKKRSVQCVSLFQANKEYAEMLKVRQKNHVEQKHKSRAKDPVIEPVEDVIEDDLDKGQGEQNVEAPIHPNNMIKYSWPVQLWMTNRMLPSQDQMTNRDSSEIPTQEQDKHERGEKLEIETDTASPVLECVDVPEPEDVLNICNPDAPSSLMFPDNMLRYDWPVIAWAERRMIFTVSAESGPCVRSKRKREDGTVNIVKRRKINISVKHSSLQHNWPATLYQPIFTPFNCPPLLMELAKTSVVSSNSIVEDTADKDRKDDVKMIKYSWPIQLWVSPQSILPSPEQMPDKDLSEIDLLETETDNASLVLMCEDIPEQEDLHKIFNPEDLVETKYPDNCLKYDWPVLSWAEPERMIFSLSVSEDNFHSPRPKRKHEDEEDDFHQPRVKRIRVLFKPTQHQSRGIPILLPTFDLPKELEGTVAVVKRRKGTKVLSLPYNWPVALYQPIFTPFNCSPLPMELAETCVPERIRVLSPQHESRGISILLPMFDLPKEFEEDTVAVVKRRKGTTVLSLPYNWPVALYQPILIPLSDQSPHLMDEPLMVVDTSLKRKYDDGEANCHQPKVKRIRVLFKPARSPQRERCEIPILLPTFVLSKESEEDTIAIVKKRKETLLSLTYNWPVALYQPNLIPLNDHSPHMMDEEQTPREFLMVADTSLKRKHNDQEANSHQPRVKRLRVMFKTTKLPSSLPMFALHKECEENIIVKRRSINDAETLLALPYNWPVALYQPILIPVTGPSSHLMDEMLEDDAAEVMGGDDDAAEMLEDEDDAVELVESDDDGAKVEENEDDLEALEKEKPELVEDVTVTPMELLMVVDTSLKRKLPREFMLNDENYPKRIKLDRGKLTLKYF